MTLRLAGSTEPTLILLLYATVIGNKQDWSILRNRNVFLLDGILPVVHL